MKKKKSEMDPFGGFLVDLFPDEYLEHARQNLFGKELINEKMNHDVFRETVIHHALNDRLNIATKLNHYYKNRQAMYEELDQQKQSIEFIQNKIVNKGSGYVQVSGGTPNITINIGDTQQKQQAEPVQEAVVVDEQQEILDKLKNVCYGDANVAKTFLEQIKGMKSTEITMLVYEYVEAKKISEYSSHRNLWTILHDSGLYEPSESNWNIALKKR